MRRQQRYLHRCFSLKTPGSGSVKSIHKLPRVFVDTLTVDNVRFTVTGDIAEYLVTVMRMKTGHSFRAFNTSGEHLCVIDDIVFQKQRRKSSAVAGVHASIVKTICLPECDKDMACHLYVSPIRARNMKKMVEMATELGVSSITPVLCQNTNAKLESLEALHRLATGATEQSERLSVPEIYDPVNLADAVNSWLLPSTALASDTPPPSCDAMASCSPAVFTEPLLVCRERKSHTAVPILACLRGILQTLPVPCRMGVLVGPEGGFTEEELTWLEGMEGVRMVTLGDTILRSETAVAAALSCIQNFVRS